MRDNNALVNYLVEKGSIETEKVERAFRNIDRKDFVPEKFAGKAYEDRPLPLETGATISAPSMVAVATELLEAQETDRVLEIGSGSGYQAAILAELSAEVVGIEILKQLADRSRENIDRENVDIRAGNGFDAVSKEEFFDKIIYSCAVKDFEDGLKHLTDGGIIIGPVEENGKQTLKRYSGGKTTKHGRVRFVDFVEE